MVNNESLHCTWLILYCQKRFPVDAVKYIDSLEDIISSEGGVIGYQVEIVVTGLEEREVYQFEVAAESSSNNTKLGESINLYYWVP